MFDSSGTLIAHPDFTRLVNNSLTHPSENRTPRITDIETPAVSKIIQGWDRSERYEGSVRTATETRFCFASVGSRSVRNATHIYYC